ncbi:MAG: hypothetical protein MUF24_02340 [Chitinophagaceae bacterium]|jgi:hypothetical protein|nr:hypothetical protein [Chitinophagaceae bacterium]
MNKKYCYTLIVTIVVSIVIAGCGADSSVDSSSNAPVGDANVAYYNSIRHLTGLQFQPRVQKGDSIQLVYYKNPDGEAKRYSRFYTEYNSTDTVLVNALRKSIDKHFVRIEKVKDCRNEGKFHFFSGGNPMQTVYFANRGDSCNHLYFIQDGWFFYMDMDSSTAQLLKAYRSRAVSP